MRMSGRAWRNGCTSSSPLPSPSRKSSTAKAGGRAVCASASATDPTAVTMKPSSSSARAMRLRKAASSSAISSVRSLVCVAPAMTGDTERLAPFSWLMAILQSGRLCSLEDGVWPAHDHGRTVLVAAAVAETHRGTGPFQQRLGDEDPQPHMAFHTLAGGNEGRAELVEQCLGKARPVVGNLDLGPFGRPARGDVDFMARERHGVLHDIADALHDLRTAHLDRRGVRHALADRAGLEGDGDAVAAIVLRRRLDQRRQ